MFQTCGIDIGTTFITVFQSKDSSVLRLRHEGKIRETLRGILHPLDPGDSVVFTGKGGRDIAGHMNAAYIDEAVALSLMLSSGEGGTFRGKTGRVIDIGASSLTLYTVHEGKVVDIAKNTLCAAGTGLFLEEQAERLDIDLEARGQLDIDDPPLIASRCTVFAKSDLIHHQQEGRGKDQMWAGLCRSLVVSAVNTLFRGEELNGEIMICGGVSQNLEVLRWFRQLYPQVHWVTAGTDGSLSGEAVLAMGASFAQGTPRSQLDISFQRKKKTFKRMPPLTLNRSAYPDMPEPLTDEHGNEIRVHGDIHAAETLILGMDIGSTSTKLGVLDGGTLEPLLDIYGSTAGDPVGAAQKIFASFYEHTRGGVPVQAFGTTGSGRKLVGEIFGADLIVNEISAHAKGAVHFHPGVETIFEIGGQDAKFIRLIDGYAADVNMNYVCAAGTGSFVEEQARKLGYPVQRIGGITAGIAPPVTSDRCTVFMEQDLRALLKEGFSKEEALASVLYSVIQNYLNRVVGNRKISDKVIFFQGATARNRGLVAALENLLDVEVAVSTHCHLMGAVGAALKARDFVCDPDWQERPVSRFVGIEAVDLEVASRTDLCRLCRNFCRINFVSRQSGGSGAEFSWGYQCGRDPEESVRKEIPGFRLFREREKIIRSEEVKKSGREEKKDKGTVTLIHALTNYTFFPLWVNFFRRLGYRVEISGRTDHTVKKHATGMASGDFCYPVKVALGHMVKALEKQRAKTGAGDHHVFMPYMIADKPHLDSAHSFFCPYVESSPSIMKSTLARNNVSTAHLLSPVIDMRDNPREIAESLYTALRTKLGIKKKNVLAAFRRAYEAWDLTSHRLEGMGKDMLAETAASGDPVFLLVGRPYNLHDRGVNLGLPEKIAGMGYTVIPIDMLPLDTAELSGGNYHNIFWKYGQRIMAAMRTAKQHGNVFPIYLSNFNCGPDSFLLTYAEEELDGKPMLVLELDEHDSDGGYLTRIEAFLDVVHSYLKENPPLHGESLPHVYTADRPVDREGTVWIPPMHYPTHRFYAASFRRFGYDSRYLDMEDQEALVLGKKHLRGGECLPMALTLGGFLKRLKHEDQKDPERRHILFMPSAEGPCRFGQYNLLERIVFHRLGLKHVDILSPSSVNSYQGLPEGLRRQLMHGTVAGDVLAKMLHKVRPYERSRGDAEELFNQSTDLLDTCLEKGESLLKPLRRIAKRFASIPVVKERKPLVAIVGEIYVRCNAFSNGNLVEQIEANGGEAWLAPVHEWVLYAAYMQSFANRRGFLNLLYKSGSWVNNFYFFRTERAYYDAAAEMLHDREEPHIKEVVAAGAGYLPEEFSGEAILTIGRAVLFAKQGASMVVNTAPFGCMPGILSGSILLEIKEKLDIPFISLFYDGNIDANDKVASLLKTITLDQKQTGDMDIPQASA
jgi:predicted CoA-substrate-specific enzyme activase